MLDSPQELSGTEHSLEVTIRYGNLEKTMTGSPEIVAKEVFAFLNSVIPQLQLASRLALSTDLSALTKAVEGIMAVTPEGVVLMVSPDGLTDRELILLHLARANLSHLVGKSDKDTLQASELLLLTKRTSGTVAGRLSELCRENLAERKGKGEYRATTLGVHVFQEQILPKLKMKLGV
ncbi:MAG TPA: hypothetical protein VJZ32_06830 [Candidatus Bathyarchaeia archaeon]|nr:hypothetical protein [Candidatus Bathyarchaeia archaeon]